MEQFDFKEHSHRRLNILTGEWILVSPHRSKRPWQGKIESIPLHNRPAHDPACYLCSGNKRADGTVNPYYKRPFSFTNDFSALLKSTPTGKYYKGNLLKACSETGICRVVIFSNRHDITLPELSVDEIRLVIDLWCREFIELSQDFSIRSVQIFENKGDVMGCSNPHPHGQIWAQTSLPQEIIRESVQQKRYSDVYGTSLLSDYLKLELELDERIVVQNVHFVALVPFWAVWPYETMIISRRKVRWLTDFTENEKESFADILKKLTTRYDNIFGMSFPYSAGIHQAPVNDGDHFEWHWHMHFYPPLLRSATVKKFMVGYEMLANPQRDITAEVAAATLRSMCEVHYRKGNSVYG